MKNVIRTHEIPGDSHHHPIRYADIAYGVAHDYWIDPTDPQSPQPSARIKFQKGPVREAGENGIDDMDLLAILDHRMQDFSQLPNPDRITLAAAAHIRAALKALLRRKKLRMSAGTEGTSK